MKNALYFKTQGDLRKWFIENHLKEKEMFLGYYKKATKKPSVNWSESVDEALCFGWIDGVRRRIDEERYCIRFTPRKEKSHWSAVNLKKIKTLKKEKLMYPAGLAAFKKMDPKNSEQFVYEQKEKMRLSKEFEDRMKTNEKAWTFFENLAPGYTKHSVHWVMSAKQEATREKRFKVLVESCEAELKIPLLRKYK